MLAYVFAQVMRAEKIEEEQRRRQTIVAAKVEKETALLQKLRNISRLRYRLFQRDNGDHVNRNYFNRHLQSPQKIQQKSGSSISVILF